MFLDCQRRNFVVQVIILCTVGSVCTKISCEHPVHWKTRL
jgi:hypothetical protein